MVVTPTVSKSMEKYLRLIFWNAVKKKPTDPQKTGFPSKKIGVSKASVTIHGHYVSKPTKNVFVM